MLFAFAKTDQLSGNCADDQHLFLLHILSLFFLNLKFQASSHILCLYSPVYVGPGQNPKYRFSHEMPPMQNYCVVCLGMKSKPLEMVRI